MYVLRTMMVDDEHIYGGIKPHCCFLENERCLTTQKILLLALALSERAVNKKCKMECFHALSFIFGKKFVFSAT
jgi:hypothetical protein